MNDPISTVTAIYEAFGRGDVPTIMGHLAPDVRWDHGIRRTAVPYLVEGTGLEHVGRFFEALGAQAEITHFEVGPVTVAGNEVMARIGLRGRNRVTGRAVEEYPEVHHWTVGADGKVTAFSHVGDWAAHESAAPGAAPAGTVLHAVGDTIEVLAEGGQFEAFMFRGPRDSGPPPHSHPWREALFGISGEVTVSIDGEVTTLAPGRLLTAEAGQLHSYRIVSDEAAFLVITGGARASAFFADLDANAPHGIPDEATLAPMIEIAVRHGLSSPLFESVGS